MKSLLAELPRSFVIRPQGISLSFNLPSCLFSSPHTWHKSIPWDFNTAESLEEMQPSWTFTGTTNYSTDERKHSIKFLCSSPWLGLIFHDVKFTCPLCFYFPSSLPLVSQYNSVNMKNKTAEEVYVEMLKPAETVTFKVQHRPDDFSILKDVPGDGFYIRYMRTHTCTLIIAGC